MYDYFTGKLVSKTSTTNTNVVVDCNGIGYLINVNSRTLADLPQIGETIKIYVSLIHKEDSMSLCGFLKREDRDIFNTLTSVSGVGAKMALVLIDTFEVSNLVGLVLEGKYKDLTKAKGVGPKLAQKIILELKDKLTSYKGAITTINSGNSNNIPSQNIEDAQMVLLSLGYEKKEIDEALSRAVTSIKPNSSAEEILKESLKILSV